jgi:flagellar M-ring protein FliF
MAQTPHAAFPQSLGHLKDLPILRQLLLLVGIAAAVAGGFTLFQWSQSPGYVPLFADLSERDAAETADTLRAAGIAYRLEPTNGQLMVPAAQVHEARLQLAAKGLPKSGESGFETMQQDPGFGVSSFLEGARYNHALETELARSISLLAPVKAARVHLAIPKPSAFARAGEGASASVLVELHAGRSLEANQVAAIVHMVASSVPNLEPGRVTVVDQFGRLVSRPADGDGLTLTAEQFDHARRVEADYVRRIEQLLTPITGAGKINAQVAAEIDFSVTEEARESYDPATSAVRSEQTAQQTTRGASTAQGVPGATSNQPPSRTSGQPLNSLAGAPGADAPVNESRNSNRSFELDRTLSHTRQAVGKVERLSVAVLIDDLPKPDGKGGTVLKSLSPEELAKLEALVREAVGFDEERGDRVSVQNLGFLPAEVPASESQPIWKQPQAQNLARQVFGAGLLLVLIFAVLRPTLKNLLQPPKLAALPVSGGVLMPVDGAAALAQEPTRERVNGRTIDAVSSEEPPPYEQKLQAARAAVAQDPKRVAQVVKSWLGEENG